MTLSRCGVVIGRFNPPHRGHKYLIDCAQELVNELYVFICSLADDEIPGAMRYMWMCEIAARATVVHITEADPRAHRDVPQAYKIWASTILHKMQGRHPQYVFASEDYGENFARELEAHFIPIDPGRYHFPISSSDIRLHPFRYWEFIPETVRPWYVKRIAVCAGEQSEMLARDLARALKTCAMPLMLSISDGSSTPPMLSSDELHGAMEYALCKQANYFLFVYGETVMKQTVDRYIFLRTHEIHDNDVYQQVHADESLRTKTSFFEYSPDIVDKIVNDLLNTFSIATVLEPC